MRGKGGGVTAGRINSWSYAKLYIYIIIGRLRFPVQTLYTRNIIITCIIMLMNNGNNNKRVSCRLVRKLSSFVLPLALLVRTSSRRPEMLIRSLKTLTPRSLYCIKKYYTGRSRTGRKKSCCCCFFLINLILFSLGRYIYHNPVYNISVNCRPYSQRRFEKRIFS